MTAPQPPPRECTVPLVELDITEELDLPHLPEVGAVLDRILSLQPREVVIDLSECRHIDAAAIGLLLDVHRRLARRKGVLTIRNPNPRIRRILATARLEQVLPIVDAPARALETEARPAPARPADGPVAHGRAKVTARP